MQKTETWSKEVDGRHAYSLNLKDDCLALNTWLIQEQLFGETKGFMCAIRDQVINTPNFRLY